MVANRAGPSSRMIGQKSSVLVLLLAGVILANASLMVSAGLTTFLLLVTVGHFDQQMVEEYAVQVVANLGGDQGDYDLLFPPPKNSPLSILPW